MNFHRKLNVINVLCVFYTWIFFFNLLSCYATDDICFKEGSKEDKQCTNKHLLNRSWHDIITNYKQYTIIQHIIILSRFRQLIIISHTLSHINLWNPVMIIPGLCITSFLQVNVILCHLIVIEAWDPMHNDQHPSYKVKNTNSYSGLQIKIKKSYFIFF